MMTEKQSFHLFTYNSWILFLSIIGFGVLGAGILFIFQGMLEIPAWIQYILLTLWLAADFLFSSYAAAKPTTIKVSENGLSLENDLDRTAIPWTDIQSHNFVDKLLFNSLKIKLKNMETISIIDFKWRGNKEIYGFLQSMHLHQTEDQMEEEVYSGNKIKTFFQSNLKTIFGIIFFMVYVNISSNLEDRGAFYTWNPITIYLYWVLPILTFFKLVFTK
jgi:hypothetical protein